jgi:hypothetical protein
MSQVFLVLQLAWDRRSQQIFTTCWLLLLAWPEPALAIGIFSFFACVCQVLHGARNVEGSTRHCDTREMCNCAHRVRSFVMCRPVEWAVTSASSLVESGGGGRREKAEKYSVWRKSTSSEKHLVLYRDIPLSIEPAQRKIPIFLFSIIIIITNYHAFLNSLTESFGRTSDVTWSRLCS